MAPERIVFPMKWSPVVRTVTAAVNCLFVAIPLLAMLLAPETWPLAAGIGGCVGIPVWLICRGYCPRVLEADERNLTIRRRMFGDVVIRVSEKFATAMHIDSDESNACGGANEGEIVE